MHLGLCSQTIYLWNFRLLVMLGVSHLAIQIILVNELEHHGKNSGAAVRHFFYVISVAKYEGLP